MKISLSTTSWFVPKPADLKLEYAYEYMLPSRNWKARCSTIGAKYPLFDSEEDFIAKVNAGKIISVTKKSKIHNMTTLSTLDDLQDLVNSYRFPRDIAKIVKGYNAGKPMPMPIIIKGSKGSWILCGNTRSNVAFIMDIPLKAIEVDAT